MNISFFPSEGGAGLSLCLSLTHFLPFPFLPSSLLILVSIQQVCLCACCMLALRWARVFADGQGRQGRFLQSCQPKTAKPRGASRSPEETSALRHPCLSLPLYKSQWALLLGVETSCSQGLHFTAGSLSPQPHADLDPQ